MQKKAFWKVLLLDILMAGVLLLIFAFFHHGLTWLRMQSEMKAYQAELQEQQTQEKQKPAEPKPSEQPKTSGEAKTTEPPEEKKPEETSAEPEVEPTEEPQEEEPVEEEPVIIDNRTEWQKKFEDHFTDEIVITDNSYSSPNVSITVTTVQTSDEALAAGEKRVTYYVADIYIGSIECFRRAIANNKFAQYTNQDAKWMAIASNALIGITGDFFSVQAGGLEAVNGEIKRTDDTTADICVLYYDGTMETLSKNEYDKEELLNSGAVWNMWHFGPRLLTAEGEVPEEMNASYSLNYTNPRSAVGYYEPGHYCFIVVDGRQGRWSDGFTLSELAEVFYELGCKCAYNMDGGGSAVMTFMDKVYSRQCNERTLSDLLIICDLPEAEEESGGDEG